MLGSDQVALCPAGDTAIAYSQVSPHDMRMRNSNRSLGATLEFSPRVVRPSRQPPRPWRRALLTVSLSVVLAVLSTMVLLFASIDAGRAEVKLDIVKIALATGAGAGGLVTLLMGVRGQLLAEESADETRRDANERRVIDLLTRGVEQLGSDRPEVRVGGLYALERLADHNQDLREQVMDIVCVLLQATSASNQSARLPKDIESTFLRFIVDHVAYVSPYAHHKSYWAEVEMINLSGARLVLVNFMAAKVDTMHFRQTVFEEDAHFKGAAIRGANFTLSTFEGGADFEKASLGRAVFVGTHFQGLADFSNATFYIDVDFTDAVFAQTPNFAGARLAVSGVSKAVMPTGWKIAQSDEGGWSLIEPDFSGV